MGSREILDSALRVSAPARANLLGNPSDLYGGAVLACSVPLRARVEIEPGPALELTCPAGTRRIDGVPDLALRGDAFDLARAVLASLAELPRCRIRWRSEIPLKSGLAGSTALLVALLHGLLARAGRPLGPYGLAERARQVERKVLGVTCGWVDQYLCTFGGLRYVDFRGKEREPTAEGMPFATVEPLADAVTRLPFLLAFTGVRHESGAVHAPIRARWERGEVEVTRACARMAEIALEGKAALLREDWRHLGTLMNENHALQRDLGGSGPANERLIDAALAAGALGAKLAGAGHGGTIVALWLEADVAPLEVAMQQAGAAACYRPEPVPGVTLERREATPRSGPRRRAPARREGGG